jgi:hypothetical protein
MASSRNVLMIKRGYAALLICFVVAPAVLADEAVTAHFTNLAYAYPRGERCLARLMVSGADEVRFDVGGWLAKTVEVTDGQALFEIDTALLRAGDYTVRAKLLRDGQEVGLSQMPLSIGPPRDTQRMPIWRWGSMGYTINELRFWHKSGFTGSGIGGAGKNPVAAGTTRDTSMQMMDEAVRLGFDAGYVLEPVFSDELHAREDVRGVYANGVQALRFYPLAPAAMEHAVRTTDTYMQYVGQHPALRFLFLNTEYEPPLAPHPTAIRLAQEEIGLDLMELPIEEGYRKRGHLNVNPAAFANGVIPDDHPHYRFLKWWHERGHGTNAMNAAMAETAKQHRPELITYHDPYRLVPVRHTHQGLDMISTWTYGFPDIKRLVYTTYLQAAARPDDLLVQQCITTLLYGWMTMDMTQPADKTGMDFGQHAQWGFVGFTPDYCREATWLVVSQRPDVLGYFVSSALDYYNTKLDPSVVAPEALGAITEVSDYLIKPYGPTILDSERWQPSVAVLASATGLWFHTGASNAAYGAEMTLPYATLLMMNHTPFDVLLDDDLIEGGATRYKALILPFSATVTQTMADRLNEYIAAGGRVIVNEPFRLDLPGAIRTNYDFTFEHKVSGAVPQDERITAEEHRVRMEQYADDLAQHLTDLRGPVRTGKRVLSNSLDAGSVRYHFLINDERIYGPRFGEHEIFFESGAPQYAQVTIADPQRQRMPGGYDDNVNIALPVLYDVIRRQELSVQPLAAGAVRFGIGLSAGGGKLIASLPERISRVSVERPEQVTAGEPVTIRIAVLGESGQAIRGSLPLRVDVDDASGRRTEWSRYTTTRHADGGICEFTFIPALNDLAGHWTIHVRDLVSDQVATVTLRVSEVVSDPLQH